MILLFSKVFIAVIGVIGFLITSIGLPGNTLIFLSAVVFALLDGFQIITETNLGVLAIIYLVGELWEFVVGYLGIKKEKVSWKNVLIIGIITFIGGLVGSGILPVIGSVLGAAIASFMAAFILEYLQHRNEEQAFKVACVAAKNQFLAIIGKLICASVLVIMIVKYLFF